MMISQEFIWFKEENVRAAKNTSLTLAYSGEKMHKILQLT